MGLCQSREVPEAATAPREDRSSINGSAAATTAAATTSFSRNRNKNGTALSLDNNTDPAEDDDFDYENEATDTYDAAAKHVFSPAATNITQETHSDLERESPAAASGMSLRSVMSQSTGQRFAPASTAAAPFAKIKSAPPMKPEQHRQSPEKQRRRRRRSRGSNNNVNSFGNSNHNHNHTHHSSLLLNSSTPLHQNRIVEEEDPTAPSDEEDDYLEYEQEQEPGRLVPARLLLKHTTSPQSVQWRYDEPAATVPDPSSMTRAQYLQALEASRGAVQVQHLQHFQKLKLQVALQKKQENKLRRLEKLQDRRQDVDDYQQLWRDFEAIQAAESISTVPVVGAVVGGASETDHADGDNNNIKKNKESSLHQPVPLKRSDSFTLKDSKSWYFDFQAAEFNLPKPVIAIRDGGGSDDGRVAAVDYANDENASQSGLSLLSVASMDTQRLLYAEKRRQRRHGKKSSSSNNSVVSGVSSVRSNLGLIRSSSNRSLQSSVRHADYGPVRASPPSANPTSMEVSFVYSSPDEIVLERDADADDASLVSDIGDDYSLTGSVCSNNDYRVPRRVRRTYNPEEADRPKMSFLFDEEAMAAVRKNSVEAQQRQEAPQSVTSTHMQVLGVASPLPHLQLMDRFELAETPDTPTATDREATSYSAVNSVVVGTNALAESPLSDNGATTPLVAGSVSGTSPGLQPLIKIPSSDVAAVTPEKGAGPWIAMAETTPVPFALEDVASPADVVKECPSEGPHGKTTRSLPFTIALENPGAMVAVVSPDSTVGLSNLGMNPEDKEMFPVGVKPNSPPQSFDPEIASMSTEEFLRMAELSALEKAGRFEFDKGDDASRSSQSFTGVESAGRGSSVSPSRSIMGTAAATMLLAEEVETQVKDVLTKYREYDESAATADLLVTGSHNRMPPLPIDEPEDQPPRITSPQRRLTATAFDVPDDERNIHVSCTVTP
jgi:hypothetical protein